MTFQLSNTVSRIFSACLSDPGTAIPKLYRSDGITQNSVVEQLFANHYRNEPYEYLVSTEHENALMGLEQYFALARNEFEAHIRSKHEETLEDFAVHEDCGAECIGHVLRSIDVCIREHASTTRLDAETASNGQVVERVLAALGECMTFVVVVQEKLPSLSCIVKTIVAENYPNSLWKFLYGRILEHLYRPLEERLSEILLDGIKEQRLNAIKKAMQNEKTTSFDYVAYDTICKLHEVSLLLAGKYLDERSVYFAESTTYASDPILDQALKFQTASLYQLLSVDQNSVLAADIQTIQSILTPSQAAKLIPHCTALAKCVRETEGSELDLYECRDAEIEMHARRLGLAE